MTTDDGLNLDAISLEQALKDVEVANGRVIDLTRRLSTISKELAELRQTFVQSDIGKLELENQRLRSEVAALRLKLVRTNGLTKPATA